MPDLRPTPPLHGVVELIINGQLRLQEIRLRNMAPTDAITPTVGGSPAFLTPPELFVRFAIDTRFFARPFCIVILYYI